MLEHLQVGDAILLGGNDVYSRCVQIGGRSRFSHILLYAGSGHFVEAYDYSLCPDEESEGVYETSIRDVLARSDRIRRIRIIRPAGVDALTFRVVAKEAVSNSPYFSSTGVFLLAACGIFNPFIRTLPPRFRAQVMGALTGFVGDGGSSVQCAEFAARLYHAAGVEVAFGWNRLSPEVEYLRRRSDDIAFPFGPERFAHPSGWEPVRSVGALIRNVFGALAGLLVSLGRRTRSGDSSDWADFVLPGDFETARNFSTIGEYRWSYRQGKWVENGVTDAAIESNDR